LECKKLLFTWWDWF